MKRPQEALRNQVKNYGIDDSIAEYLDSSGRDFELPTESPAPHWLKRFVQNLSDLVAGAPRHVAPGTTAQVRDVALGPCNRFSLTLARVRTFGGYSPARNTHSSLGYFGGRPMIAEGSQINGGVYLSPLPQEALVVDARHGAVDQVFREVHSVVLAKNCARKLSEDQILQEIVNICCAKLRFDPHALFRLVRTEQIEPDQKISLDLFLTAGIGVARHQALLAAYLVESFKEKGLLRGFYTLDGSSFHKTFEDERLIYTSENGRIFVFDPLSLHGTQPEAR